jgi:hypothetical protein
MAGAALPMELMELMEPMFMTMSPDDFPGRAKPAGEYYHFMLAI